MKVNTYFTKRLSFVKKVSTLFAEASSGFSPVFVKPSGNVDWSTDFFAFLFVLFSSLQDLCLFLLFWAHLSCHTLGKKI